ncbi:MAG: segregation/condensation protein A, partial [Gammaproteobacteria bacterium]
KTFTHHHIRRENLSVREKMTYLLSKVSLDQFTQFDDLFIIEEGRAGIVVTFLAILELLKADLLEVSQQQPFATIYVRAAG